MKLVERLQGLEERIKRRWMVAFSVIATLIISYLWLFYIGTLLTGTGSRSYEEAYESPVTVATLRGVASTMYRGGASILRSVGTVLRLERSYTITPRAR